MKKTRFFAIMAALALVFSLGLSGFATAQWDLPDRSVRTASPIMVATLYHIMQRKQPDIAAWARETEAYKNAQGFDKNVVLDAEMQRLRDELRLITPFEPIVVNTVVRLSRYSDATKGYMVQGLGAGTFFGYEFAGENYAIVLPRLADYEWIGVEGKMHEDIEASIGSSNRHMRLAVKMSVNYADKNPVVLNNKSYNLLSGNIMSLELYPLKGSKQNTALWWHDSVQTSTEAQQELFQLKK